MTPLDYGRHSVKLYFRRPRSLSEAQRSGGPGGDLPQKKLPRLSLTEMKHAQGTGPSLFAVATVLSR